MSNTYTKVIEILEGAAERAAQQAFSDIHACSCVHEIQGYFRNIIDGKAAA